MDQRTINEIVTYLKESLVESGINVDSIALFGSAISGELTTSSDLDIIIISEDFRDKDIFERAKITMNPEVRTIRKFKVPLDVLNMTVEEYNRLNERLVYRTKVVA
jgi:predicted nucleotidyltransferase